MNETAKVLVVDDTPHNVKLLADLLAVKGYAVATAVNGEEALAKVASERPDLVLLDVMMPGLSGFETLTVTSGSSVATVNLTNGMTMNQIISAVKEFAHGAEQYDDVTALVVKYTGPK